MKPLIIGLDFDNTIVCYNEVFYTEAVRKNLIPLSIPPSKEKIRNELRRQGREDEWTELQGYVYGKCMHAASIFPGFLDFVAHARSKASKLYIISHKSRVPFRGPAFDLHQSALAWLEENGFFSRQGFSLKEVHFLETKLEKLECIGQLACSHFIDDLPEFLTEREFPAQTLPILFNPENKQLDSSHSSVRSFQTWAAIKEYVFNGNS